MLYHRPKMTVFRSFAVIRPFAFAGNAAFSGVAALLSPPPENRAGKKSFYRVPPAIARDDGGSLQYIHLQKFHPE